MPSSPDTPASAVPSLIVPWLALGVGLAALSTMPDVQVATAAAALPPPITVAAVDLSAVDYRLAMHQAPDLSLPAPPVIPRLRVIPGVSTIGALSAEPGPEPKIPSAVADAMFAVSGSATRPLPAGFVHPLVGEGDPVHEDEPAEPSLELPGLGTEPEPIEPEPIEAGPSEVAPVEVAEEEPAADAEPVGIEPEPVAPEPATPPVAQGQPTEAQWAELRWCESSGNYEAVSATGKYQGAYQFDQTTWESVGGTGTPATASPAEQDRLAKALYAERGSQPWPYCGRYLS